MARLQGKDAALVATALVQAEMSLLAAVASGRKDQDVSQSDKLVRMSYERHLAYVLGYDPDTGTGKA